MPDTPEEQTGTFARYPLDFWSFVTGPYAFLTAQNLTSAKTIERSVAAYLLGVGGVVAFSAVNMKLAGYDTPVNKQFFEGTQLITAMLVMESFVVVLAYLMARILRGKGSLAETLVAFGFALGFTWPPLALGGILVGRTVNAVFGTSDVDLPPFS